MSMRFVIGGLAGTGKSTLARALASTLGLPMLSIGGLFRAIAEERGVPLSVIDEEAMRDRAIDDEMARRVNAYAHEHPFWVIEGRFAWHTVGDAANTFKVKLVCHDVVRFAHIAVRDEIGLSQARQETLEREAMLIERFQERSGVPDWNGDHHYDLVLDVTALSPREVFEAVVAAFSAHSGLP